MLKPNRMLRCCNSFKTAHTPNAGKLRYLAVRAGKQRDNKTKDEGPYSKTVNLPQTPFQMRANSVVKEPQIQEFWEKNKIYETLSRSNPGDVFTLHDGPPYANGDLHIGHALNKILKDFINRYQLLHGKRARLVPGWDCHGLPIELKVLQSMKSSERKDLTTSGLRQRASEFALSTLDVQREQFKRYGIWADWEDPYVTLNPQYEAEQLRVFGRMVLNGHIYRGRKPVHWSPSSRTALAEAELEYPEGHTSRSIYVSLPVSGISQSASENVQKALEGSGIAIWTTTPWTIPANMAVAVNGDLDYAVVEIGEDSQGNENSLTVKKMVVAVDLIPTLAEKFNMSLKVLCTCKGTELEGCTYAHPLFDRTSPVLIGGDYITTDTGTGLVHTAPGHGQEDFQVGQKHGLPLLSPVDDAGRFTEEAGPFQGLEVQGEGNQAIIDALKEKGALIKEEQYAHKYPYDWRTKKPTIFRATDQWFASVDGFRHEALNAINNVNWYPASGKNRITSMTEGRSDWCISRQRKWGVPIPVFYDKDSGDPLMTEETINHIASIFETEGSNAWWSLPISSLLPENLRHMAENLVKGEDTMDVWFDSGSSWAGVLQCNRDGSLNYPADLYLEGSDQHRGWFQSSLLTSVAANGVSPYQTVLTHGFVLDDKGTKMSKSLGNVVDPRTVIEGGNNAKKEPAYGADVLRLWVASVDYSSDVLIGDRILSQVADVYRKIRFTLRYLLGNLYDFDPEKDAVPYEQLSSTDRYILSKFANLVTDCKKSYESYQFNRVYQALQRFVVLDLSNFYLDVAKDRLYISDPESTQRRACQTVLNALLSGMLPLIAPILPHMAEDAWQSLPYKKKCDSIFQLGWATIPDAWMDLQDEEREAWNALLVIRAEVNQLLERARTGKLLGSSLEAKISIHVSDCKLKLLLDNLQKSNNGQDQLRYLFIVSQVHVVNSAEDISNLEYKTTAEVDGVSDLVSIGVDVANGRKCARCWNYSTHVGENEEHPEICERCLPVLENTGALTSIVQSV